MERGSVTIAGRRGFVHAGRMSSPAIFVVDDQASFRTVARAVVAAAGCVLAGEAENAEDARRSLGTVRADLVLIDVNLGADSGITLTRELMTDDPDLRIVLVSTMAAIDLPSDAHDAGALAFLEKSRLDPETLRELVSSSPDLGV